MVIVFWCSFAVTLALLAATVLTGRKGWRRAHFIAAPSAVVALAVTIVLTEQLVAAVNFPEAEMRIHLWFAKSAAALLIPVIATGLLTIRRSRWLRLHRIAVVLFLLTVLIATGTGIWVFTLSTPL